MAWNNPDGLYMKTGYEKATATQGKGGEYSNDGLMREIELKINLASLTQTETILSDVITLPKSVRIAEISVVTTTAAATGAAIDLGLIRTSDRSTEVDYDGLLAAFPIASMNANGETTTLVQGTTYAGALVGTTTAYPAHISASATTATAFTAGELIVRIRYYRP